LEVQNTEAKPHLEVLDLVSSLRTILGCPPLSVNRRRESLCITLKGISFINIYIFE